jgi:hypothetical protein
VSRQQHAQTNLEPAKKLDYTESAVILVIQSCQMSLKGYPMKLKQIFCATALTLASSVAMAMHCPADMKKIDDALAKNPSLSAAQMGEVKKLRADGEAAHKAGKHQDSVDTLAKAMKILGI